MNKRTLTCVIVFVLAALGGAVAAADRADQLLSSGQIVPFASSYWTPDRMSKAQPYPMERASMKSAGASNPRSHPTPRGPEVIGYSGYPDDYRPARRDDSSGISEAPFVGAQGYSYPPPFARYENFDQYSVYPYKTVAKIFFSDNGSDYVCSGSSWPGRGVITAGHCVFNKDSGKYHTNVVVVPQYRNGAAPLGQFPASLLLVLQGYSDGDDAYDIGLILTSTRNGRTLSQYTGYLGGKFNAGRAQHWTIIGYPSAPPFNGGLQQICQTSFASADSSGNPEQLGAGCDQTAGCSGGPWIVHFGGRAGSWNLVNGVVSYSYSSRKKQMYTSFFGTGAKNLWDYATSH